MIDLFLRLYIFISPSSSSGQIMLHIHHGCDHFCPQSHSMCYSCRQTRDVFHSRQTQPRRRPSSIVPGSEASQRASLPSKLQKAMSSHEEFVPGKRGDNADGIHLWISNTYSNQAAFQNLVSCQPRQHLLGITGLTS